MLLFGAFGYLYCFVDVATQPNPTQLPAAQGQAVVLRYHPQAGDARFNEMTTSRVGCCPTLTTIDLSIAVSTDVMLLIVNM
ncbi:hypothetical protein CC77DRAFT_720092 [Alternaria alternata]|uniref:Secreted protein n=1 Tax=Alternaria alternata TaxID=5599 RepID=A0A177DVD0_ALTAL|nr:hypothetical protein CC77DRAFT_720092 [Alternaria alternata]XP_051585202.1 uncharacterized protein J4E82_008788 [Alternaria postmessia]KAI5372499.1 hypothetical protein J4E82_008788 [Alternaria postmessia]OAG23458.1 hypothetical protein CC77DRAFT_720092 [Alternaria alternata]